MADEGRDKHVVQQTSLDRWVSWGSLVLLLIAIGASLLDVNAGIVMSLLAVAAIGLVVDGALFVSRLIRS